MGLRLVPTSVTLIDLELRSNPILRYFVEFDSFAVVEDRTIMSEKYRVPVIFGQN